MACLAVFLLIVARLPAARRSMPQCRRHRPLPLHLDADIEIDGASSPGDGAVDRGARPRLHADRPDLAARHLFPRRRQSGPRRHGPAALWRAQLAADRRRRHRLTLAPRHRSSASSPASSAASPTRCCRASSMCSGPSRSTCWRSRSRSCSSRRASISARSRIEVGQSVAADLHHRHRLYALCGAADPRPGAVAAQQRVRARRHRARRAGPSHPAGATSCPTSRPR